MAQKILNGVHISGTTQIDFMPTHESEGILTLGRYDANTSRYHNIKSYVSSTQASNYLKFSLHSGEANTVVDVLTLKGDYSATFAGAVNMASGKITSNGSAAAGAYLELKHANNNSTDVCATINNSKMRTQAAARRRCLASSELR